MDSERYADLAVFRKTLGNMIDRFLVVHGAYASQVERDCYAAAPLDSPLYRRGVEIRRKFRKLVRRGERLLRARGWKREISVGSAILAAARAWERQNGGPMSGAFSSRVEGS